MGEAERATVAGGNPTGLISKRLSSFAPGIHRMVQTLLDRTVDD